MSAVSGAALQQAATADRTEIGKQMLLEAGDVPHDAVRIGLIP